MYSRPLRIEELQAEAERMQRRFERAESVEEFTRINDELSRRISILAPLVNVLQRYRMLAELTDRELKKRQGAAEIPLKQDD